MLIKGVLHKQFVLEDQTVNSAHFCNVYGDCVKMCEDFAPNFGDKKLAVAFTTTHSLMLPLPPGDS
jgi:hypothetical protein